MKFEICDFYKKMKGGCPPYIVNSQFLNFFYFLEIEVDLLETSKNLNARNILVLLNIFFSVRKSNDQAGQDNCALGKKKSNHFRDTKSQETIVMFCSYILS